MKRIIPIILLLLLLGTALHGDEKDYYAKPVIDYRQSLEGKSLAELRLLRNTVYAIHGYKFVDRELASYFHNQPWYQHDLRNPESYKNEKFDFSVLAPEETAFIERVKAQEEKIKQRAKVKERPTQQYHLEVVTNINKFPRFTGEAARKLEDNGFLVVPCTTSQFFQIYEGNDYQNIPNFVTSDSVLQLYHVFFDFSLREIEQQRLYPLAEALTRGMFAEAKRLYQTVDNLALQQAAAFLTVYFAVAETLLTDQAPDLPVGLRAPYEKEIALVKAHAGQAVSPLLGEMVDGKSRQKITRDYSQFIPRGHYTRTKTLQKYFLAMMWYGNTQIDVKDETRLTAVMLMTHLLQQTKNGDRNIKAETLKDVWEALYEPTVFYVGAADNLTVEHVARAMREVYGKPSVGLSDLVNAGKRETVFTRLAASNPQRIGLGPDNRSETTVTFMGQRYIPDSEMFARLTHPNVPNRAWPTGLDIMAVLEMPEAAALLEKHYQSPEKFAWQKYLAARNKLIADFRKIPAGQWSANLYWSWLDSLRVLTKPASAQSPYFASTKAWRIKQLNAALGSWAELRHDTILYAKQSVAECGGEDLLAPPPAKGYVEPVPEFFARLLQLHRQTVNGLAKRDLLTERFEKIGKSMEELLVFLERLARKQLTGEPITDAEYEQLKRIGSEMEYLTLSLIQSEDPSIQGFEYLTGPDRRVALAADVHNVLNQVLEVAVGDVREIFVVIERNGELVLASGGVFAYHEFSWPAADRLTDEKWQQMLDDGSAPPSPEWINEFFAPLKDCQDVPAGYIYDSGC